MSTGTYAGVVGMGKSWLSAERIMQLAEEQLRSSNFRDFPQVSENNSSIVTESLEHHIQSESLGHSNKQDRRIF